jgi:hypothetical protein
MTPQKTRFKSCLVETLTIKAEDPAACVAASGAALPMLAVEARVESVSDGDPGALVLGRT